jgi:hypothetical protein
MAITTYSELQTAVANWLNRSDLTSRIPEFITLAEADIRRELRARKLVGAINMDAGVASKALPTSVKELKSLRYNTSSMQGELREMTPGGLAKIRQSAAGIPQAYMVVNSTVYFDRPPDTGYALELVYIELDVALSGVITTNNTLTVAPDIYLYGALLQSAPFLEHDERIAMWEDRFEKAIAKENVYREGQEFGASPEMTLPIVFGEGC